MATRPGPAGAIWPPRQRQQQQAAATPGPGPGGRARAARGAGGRGRAPPRPRHTGGRSGQGAEWCRGGGGRVRLRQAAAALGQTKTEKALGWAGLGWAGLGGTSGRAGPRLAGCAVTAWCWPLVAAGAPQKNNSQSARPATARTDRRTCCQALVTFRNSVITAPLQTYGAQNINVFKSLHVGKNKYFSFNFTRAPLLFSLHKKLFTFPC